MLRQPVHYTLCSMTTRQYYSKSGRMSRSPRHRSRSYSRSRSRSPVGYRDGGHEERNSTVFAGNLNHDTNEQHLREFFATWGTVLETKIIYDQETGRSRGFGFVKFDDQRDADDAIAEADGKILDGRPLKCNPARSGGGGRGGFVPRGHFRGGFRGGPPMRGRGPGRFGDYNNYGNNYYYPPRGGYVGGPPQPRVRRRSYSQSPGRYSPGRYSPGSQSRSASPPAKRHRRSHHKSRSHATHPEDAAAPRTAPPAAAPPTSAHPSAPTTAPPAVAAGARRPARRRGASPSGSSSYTSGSSYSTTDSERGSPRNNPPQIRAAGVPPGPGSFRKELHEAKQRENEQSMRAAALLNEVEQARAGKQELEAKFEEMQAKFQKSEESCKQFRKWLVSLTEYSRAVITGKETVRAAEAEFVQREEELGLFLKEADAFLARQKHRSGRRKREKHSAIEAGGDTAMKSESEAQNGAAATTGVEGAADAENVEGSDAAAAKFKPGIKFKLAS